MLSLKSRLSPVLLPELLKADEKEEIRMFTVLVNHIGYSKGKPKKVVVQCESMNEKPESFFIVDRSGEKVYEGKLKEYGKVASWHTGYYYAGSFDDFNNEGIYRISVGETRSEEFSITRCIDTMRLMNAVTYYFKAQRDSGEWLLDDSSLHFAGNREGTVDGHGGWYDATGDYGIHLSHLSHGTYFNPQQAAFSAYVFFKVADVIEGNHNEWYTMLKRRLLDEGYWGADFLIRMQAPSGSFFRSIQRKMALDAVMGTRCIGFEYHGSSNQFSEKAATADQETIDDTNYETSMRSGGGSAIAALAIAGRHFYLARDYTQDDYIVAAKTAYKELRNNNERYTNDGKWNLVDWYCALLAATELYITTRENEYLRNAREYASLIMDSAKTVDKNMRRLEFDNGQPYFSASDEGLPIIALLNYAEA